MDANWIMVIITGIYVLATIAIWIANSKSAKASKEQLEEMKKQFEINDSPSIEVEFHHFGNEYIGIRLINHGKHTASNIKVVYSEDFLKSINLPTSGFLYPLINESKGKECVLGVEQYTDLVIADYEKIKENKDNPPISGVVKYCFKEKDFTSEFFFDLDNYLTAFHVTSYEDEMKQAWNNTTLQLKEIKYHEAMKSFHSCD